MRSRSRPYAVLAILTALNFLNFIDRSILFQVQPLIQREFGVSKMQIGLLTTAFMICLIVAAPPLGWLADRYPRRPIIVAGAILWSGATLLTALTWNFRTLLIRHAVVGIGEAVMVVAPAYVADLFPCERRGRMLAFLYMAVPVGSALGFLIGGVLGHLYGWRAPFYVVAGPGVLAALLLLCTREPERGAHDPDGGTADSGGVLGLVRNRAYLTLTFGTAALTFAVSGAAVWMPDFLQSLRGMTMVGAGAFIAGITIVNGVGATLTGGWLADRLRRRRADADYLLTALTAAVAVPVTLAAFYMPRPAMFVAMFAAVFLLLFNFSPLAAAVVQSVGPRMRSTAVAIEAVIIRLLGDAASAPVVGHIADRTHSLQLGLLAVVAAVAVASVILVFGRRYAPRVPLAAGRSMASVGL